MNMVTGNKNFWEIFEAVAPKLDSHPVMRRSLTFRKMFQHLDEIKGRPVHVIETGCIEDPDNYEGNGCSTLLFDAYVKHRGDGSTVRSVDIVQEKVDAANLLTSSCTYVYCEDSVKFCHAMADDALNGGRCIDLVFLDASDHDWTHELPSQVHHYEELMALLPGITDETLVTVDDTMLTADDWPTHTFTGKGGLVARYAFDVGADLVFTGYQIGLKGMRRAPQKHGAQDLEEIVGRARRAVESKDNVQADLLYRLILMKTPVPFTRGAERIARGEALAHFARTARSVGRWGTSRDYYADALGIDPIANEYRCEMAFHSLRALGALDGAKREATIATRIDPNDEQAWGVLGDVEADLRNADACCAAYEKQVEVSNRSPNALLNLCSIKLDMERYDEVAALAEEIMAEGSCVGDAYHVLAMRAHRLGDNYMAIEYFDKALAHKPRNVALVHRNKSLPLHALGRYREAWKEHDWGRFENTVQAFYVPHRRFNARQWNGEEPPGRLHVHAEAGFGDNIAIGRFIPILQAQGFEICYEAMPELVELFKQSMPGVEVVPMAVDYPGAAYIKDFDWHIPIGDLPSVMNIEVDTVPWNGAYLLPSPERAAHYAKKLRSVEAATCHPKVGLVWASGIRRNLNIWMERYGGFKTMHFDQVKEICDEVYELGGFTVSLQVGPETAQAAGCELVDHVLPEKPSFAETAAVIANLDLVITVDTAVAHLAGAMGKPVWIMMHSEGSWHFMLEGTTSPWYPSARVFRPTSRGNWQSVIDQVVAALKEF